MLTDWLRSFACRIFGHRWRPVHSEWLARSILWSGRRCSRCHWARGKAVVICRGDEEHLAVYHALEHLEAKFLAEGGSLTWQSKDMEGRP